MKPHSKKNLFNAGFKLQTSIRHFQAPSNRKNLSLHHFANLENYFTFKESDWTAIIINIYWLDYGLLTFSNIQMTFEILLSLSIRCFCVRF